jgi:hypothetical protein
MKQRGFFDETDRLKELSKLGDLCTGTICPMMYFPHNKNRYQFYRQSP